MQEWIWPIGYFLRAKLYYAKALEPKKKGLLKSTISFIKTRLTSHYAHVMDSPWQSLPELTNSNGQVSTVWLVWYSVDIQISLVHCSVGFYLKVSTHVAFIKMLIFNIFVWMFYWNYLREAWKLLATLCGTYFYIVIIMYNCGIIKKKIGGGGKFWCIASILEVCWNATYFVYVFTAIWKINIHVHVNKIS